MRNKKIQWFWAHRRNSSLHYMCLLMKGLAGKGFLPAVNFWFDNQIVIGVPTKGCYIFYDRHYLSSQGKYRDIQLSIDQNPNFIQDFRKKSDQLFGAVFFKCLAFEETNFSLLTKEELARLYQEFREAITIGPIISVQLWGIEALWDKNYQITKFLKKRLKKLKQIDRLQRYKELLSANLGETVAFSEQKDFLRVAIALEKAKLTSVFKNKNTRQLVKALKRHPKEDALINHHLKKYCWMNTEYVSQGWNKEKWLSLFKQSLKDKIGPKEKLRSLVTNFKRLNQQRQNIIKQLNPPKGIRRALSALTELIAQRDWSKGYFAKILLSYRLLLTEIAKRLRLSLNELLLYSDQELTQYFLNNKTLSKKELHKRKKYGFAIVIKNGRFNLITGQSKINQIIKKEKIFDPFAKTKVVKSFKGLAACHGKVVGRARMLEDASKILEFKNGEIIVTYMTTMEFTPIFRKAKAVVTDEGGTSSHAAIVSREFNLPCVVGTKVATRIIKTGDLIEVDGYKGIVKIIK